MIQTIYSKPLYNGGRIFIKFNTDTMYYYRGNTASTAVNDHHANILIHGSTIKQINHIAKCLDDLDYKQHVNKWLDGVDTYEQIKKVGL